MPTNTIKLAMIMMSRAQAAAVAETISGLPKTVVAVSVEETNLRNTVAVTTKRGTSLVSHGGQVSKMGRGA